jgi:hypothetical protein
LKECEAEIDAISSGVHALSPAGGYSEATIPISIHFMTLQTSSIAPQQNRMDSLLVAEARKQWSRMRRKHKESLKSSRNCRKVRIHLQLSEREN